MNESDWNQLLERLAQSGTQVSLVVTGGAAGALAKCFRRPGASRNFVEAVIPYSRGAVIDFLGDEPSDSSASAAAAKQLAEAAYSRATRLNDDATESKPAAGLALVAALPTKPERRGADRIHVALHTKATGNLWSLELAKGAHTRESAETIADEMVLRALLELVPSKEDGENRNRFFDEATLTIEHTSYEV